MSPLINSGMVSGTFDLPGYRIVRVYGIVRGIVVRSRSVLGNFAAGIQTIVGGNITIFSDLCEKTREEAYELVQRNAMKTWEVKHAGRDDADFVEQLKSDPDVAKHFKPSELEKLCSLEFHFKEVKKRFKKLGL